MTISGVSAAPQQVMPVAAPQQWVAQPLSPPPKATLSIDVMVAARAVSVRATGVVVAAVVGDVSAGLVADLADGAPVASVAA